MPLVARPYAAVAEHDLQTGALVHDAAVHQGGYDLAFWSLIVPHGVLELSIIVIAGATSLYVGDAILRPGLLRRGEAFSRAWTRNYGSCLGDHDRYDLTTMLMTKSGHASIRTLSRYSRPSVDALARWQEQRDPIPTCNWTTPGNQENVVFA